MSRLQFSLVWLLGLVATVAFACAALRSESAVWASLAFSLCLGVLFVGLLGVLFSMGERRAFWAGFGVFGWGYLFLVFGPWFSGSFAPVIVTTTLLNELHPKLQRTVPGRTITVTNAARGPGASMGMMGAGGGASGSMAGSSASRALSEGSKELELTSGDMGGSPAMGGSDSMSGNGSEPVRATLISDPAMGGSDSMSGNVSGMGMGGPSGMPGAGWTVRYMKIPAPATLVGPSPEHVRRVGHSLFTLLFAGLGGLLARWFYGKRERPQPAEARAI